LANTGFLIDPRNLLDSIQHHFPLVVSVIGALLIGKGIAAEAARRTFGYTTAARRTMWSLTLPQVAATLAAALVAFGTYNPAGERLLDASIVECRVRADAHDLDPRSGTYRAIRTWHGCRGGADATEESVLMF
jgi:hypothetical protein